MRALDLVGQAYVHVEVGDSVLFATGAALDPHWVIDVLHTDAMIWIRRVSA